MTRNFDSRLSAALTEDDEAFLKRLDEPGLIEQVGDAFQGRNRAVSAFAFIMSFVIFALSVYALFQMLAAPAIVSQLLWLAVFLWASIGVGLIKIWFWMRMNHVANLRELKKIELMIVRQAAGAAG